MFDSIFVTDRIKLFYSSFVVILTDMVVTSTHFYPSQG
jgi:hypothetical protein